MKFYNTAASSSTNQKYPNKIFTVLKIFNCLKCIPYYGFTFYSCIFCISQKQLAVDALPLAQVSLVNAGCTRKRVRKGQVLVILSVEKILMAKSWFIYLTYYFEKELPGMKMTFTVFRYWINSLSLNMILLLILPQFESSH